MKDLILIKLGGSLITDKTKPFTARIETVKTIAKALQELRKEENVQFVIANGGGSFAHHVALQYKRELIDGSLDTLGFAKIQNAAATLNRIIVDELINADIPALSFHPSNLMIFNKKKPQGYSKSILHSLEKGVVPVLYGDIIWKEKNKVEILSAEKVLEYIAEILIKNKATIKRCIYLTDVEGIVDKEGKTIPLITSTNYDEIEKSLSQTSANDITGGMRHKLQQSFKMLAYCKEVIITSGFKMENIKKAILGQKIGTCIENE